LIDSHAIHTKRMADYFHNLGHEVHVITHHSSYNANDEGYEIHEIPLPNFHSRVPYGYYWTAFPKVLREIKRINPDILHGVYISNIAIYMILANSYNKILTGIGSDILIWPKRDKYINKLVELAIRNADVITVVSKHMRKILIKMGIKKRIVVYPLGIDTSQFNTNILEMDIIRKKFKNKKIVISIRRLEPIYDLEFLIQSFSSVIRAYPNTVLLILGSGSQKNDLEKMRDRLGLDKDIFFLGEIPHEDIPSYLASADIYVSTSLSDGVSISLLEAMGCGLIPIVRNIPGNLETIKDGENGFIFENNLNSLSDKLIYCIKNYDEIRESIIKLNLERIESDFNWEINMKCLLETYEELDS